MTQDDKKALREFMRGVSFTISIAGIVILIISFISWGDSVPDAKRDTKQDTKVVGTYKDCDIIQWHYGALAEYKYFLHCNNTRPVYEK
jgi:hypothetical protein